MGLSADALQYTVAVFVFIILFIFAWIIDWLGKWLLKKVKKMEKRELELTTILIFLILIVLTSFIINNISQSLQNSIIAIFLVSAFFILYEIKKVKVTEL